MSVPVVKEYKLKENFFLIGTSKEYNLISNIKIIVSAMVLHDQTDILRIGF